MEKRIIRLTESDLHRIVAESVSMILNETSTKKLANACVGAHLKTRDTGIKYGNGSNRHEAAKNQLHNFQNEWQERYAKGNTKKKAKMDQEMDDAFAARRQANQKKVEESIDEIKGLHGFYDDSEEGLRKAGNDWDEVGKSRLKKGIEDADETSIGNIKKALRNFTTGARFKRAAKMQQKENEK